MVEALEQDSIPFRINHLYAQLAEQAGPGRMLDLGCGEGKAMRPFFERGWECVGVDIDQAALQKASAYGRVILRSGEAPLHELEDESFDLITANAVFHHLKEVDFNLAELVRCLRPGKLLLVNEVVEDSFLMRLGRSVFDRWRGVPILSRYYVRDWMRVFEAHHLELLASFTQNHWRSLLVTASSALGGVLEPAIRTRFTRRRVDLRQGQPGPVMFILFALRKPDAAAAEAGPAEAAPGS